MSFVDEISIQVNSGKGGEGCLSFASSRHKVLGGPDGGDGGAGGSVIFQVNKSMASLSHLKRKSVYKAESGQSGRSGKQRGRKGKDLILEIPPRTWMTIDGKTICIENDSYLLLKGGKGGRGNFFFKNSIRQSPRKIGKGELGKSQQVFLETRLQSDVALVSWKPLIARNIFSSVLKIKNTSPVMFANKTPILGKGFSRFSVIEVPSLKYKLNGLKHILLSKCIIVCLSLESVEQCLEDFQNIQKCFDQFSSKLSQNNMAYFFIKDESLSKEDLQKIRDFFIEKKLHIFLETKTLEDFIEKQIS